MRRPFLTVTGILAFLMLDLPAPASVTLDDARSALENGQYEYAYSRWKRAVERNPSDREAIEGLSKLREVAGRLYEDALMVQGLSPDRAKEKLRTVVLITDPWSELSRQAREILGDDGDDS